jgi:uncharacterized membrane protein YphA (DoxX/SURF4 family)
VRKRLSSAQGLDKLVVFGPAFFAAPLAVFGAEHLAGANFLAQGVPPWMPGHLFWAYFVGFCLVAAALSLVFTKYVRWSAPLLTMMFCLFVAMIHLPNVVANPSNRILWAVAVRDLSFGAGALALAAAQRVPPYRTPLAIARFYIAATLIFFGVEQILHPEFAPGVPLPKVTPAWFPLHALLGYFAGIVTLTGGALLLMQKYARNAAAWVGLLFTVLTFLLYLPILTTATKPSEMNEGINYVADTLLFAGAVLLLAAAIPRTNPTPRSV